MGITFPKSWHEPNLKPKNLVELHRFCQEEWLKIETEACQKLLDGYLKHLIEVKMAKRQKPNIRSTACIFLTKQIWSHFQKTNNKFIIKPNSINMFCDEVVWVVEITGSEHVFFISVYKLLTTNEYLFNKKVLKKTMMDLITTNLCTLFIIAQNL